MVGCSTLLLNYPDWASQVIACMYGSSQTASTMAIVRWIGRGHVTAQPGVLGEKIDLGAIGYRSVDVRLTHWGDGGTRWLLSRGVRSNFPG